MGLGLHVQGFSVEGYTHTHIYIYIHIYVEKDTHTYTVCTYVYMYIWEVGDNTAAVKLKVALNPPNQHPQTTMVTLNPKP